MISNFKNVEALHTKLLVYNWAYKTKQDLTNFCLICFRQLIIIAVQNKRNISLLTYQLHVYIFYRIIMTVAKILQLNLAKTNI